MRHRRLFGRKRPGTGTLLVGLLVLGVVTCGEGQTLTVACIPVDVTMTNPLSRPPSKQLVLQIKGEDLLALRQASLSREDAKQRIIERRF